MKKQTRLIFSLLVGIASILVILVAWAFWYVQTEEFRSLLRDRALAAVRGSVNGEVTFESLSGSIWREIHVHNVSVVQNGVETLFVPRLSVKVSLIRQAFSFLSSSNVHVAKIAVEEPVLRLVQSRDGRWNIASLLKEPQDPGEKREMTVYLHRLHIERGSVEATLSDGRRMDLGALALNASLTLPPDGATADVAALGFNLSTEGYPDTAWSASLFYATAGATSGVELRHLDLRSGGSYLRLSGKIEDLAAPRSALSVEAKRLAAADLKRLVPALPLRQDLTGSFNAAGPLSALDLAGTLAAADGVVVASARADLSGDAARYEGTVEIRDFVADRVLQIDDVGGKLSAAATFQGSGSEILQASARGSVAGLHIQGWQTGNLALSAALAEKNLHFDAVTQGRAGKVDLKGRLLLGAQPAYEVSLRARGLDLTKAGGKEPMSSIPAQLNLDLWLQGRGTYLKHADVEGKLTVYPSRVGPIQITQGAAAGTLRRGEIHLREARLVSKEASLQAQGRLGNLDRDARGKITYKVAIKEIAPWMELAGAKGSGSLRIEGAASGPFRALQLEGRGNVSRLSVGGLSLQDGAARWSLAGMRGPRPHGSIQTSATGVKAGLVLNRVNADLTLEGAEPLEVRGTMIAEDREKRTHKITARVLSSAERHQIHVQQIVLQLAGGIWRLSSPAELLVQKSTVAIEDFRLQHGPQAVRLKGLWGRRGTQDLFVQAKGLPLDELRTLWQRGPEVGGLLDLEARITGSAESPVIEALLTAQPITIAGQSYQGVSGRAGYRRDELRLNFLLRQDASHSLTLLGGLPLYLGWADGKPPAVLGEADLRLKSNGLSPAFLGLITDEIENINGTLSMDLRLRGPLRALVPQGELQLRRGQGQVKSLGLLVRDVEVEARVAADKLHVTRLLARSGSGEISGSGNLTLNGRAPQAFALALRAEDFRVLNRRDLQGAVTGRISVSGSPERPWVRGDLAVTESSLRPDLPQLRRGPPPPEPTIIVVQSEEELAMPPRPAEKPEAERPAQNGFLHKLGLDLSVKIPRNTWVRLDEGAVELAGALRARKEAMKPISLTGAIETVRGTYNFQGKQFRIERGKVVFTGGSQIDPQLDVVARYRVAKYLVDMVVGGTATKPTLTLKSDPPLEQADVLAVLLFGKPVGALSESQQVGLRSQAIKATADFVGSDLRQSVARRLGLDNLEFEFGEEVSQGRVAVGKYVSEDVFVSASQGVGKEKEQEYSLEYQLAPNLQLRSSTSTQGKSGIDLIWRKEY